MFSKKTLQSLIFLILIPSLSSVLSLRLPLTITDCHIHCVSTSHYHWLSHSLCGFCIVPLTSAPTTVVSMVPLLVHAYCAMMHQSCVRVNMKGMERGVGVSSSSLASSPTFFSFTSNSLSLSSALISNPLNCIPPMIHKQSHGVPSGGLRNQHIL